MDLRKKVSLASSADKDSSSPSKRNSFENKAIRSSLSPVGRGKDISLLTSEKILVTLRSLVS